MATWASYYNYILPDLMGVPTAVVDFELRRVCRDLCEQALVHSEEVTPINVVANTATYTLAPVTAETEPVIVKSAWYNDAVLDKAPMDILGDAMSQWQDVSSTSPYAYTQRRPDQITLFPVPSEALTAGLRVEINLRPSLAATGLTDWIATNYIYAIADGVKGKLMAQPGKPWTNPELSAYHTGLYEAAKTRATVDANRSFTRAVLSARPRPAA